ncbi:autotransporter assembly complex protein TamA [Saccharospirillum mangrovi]|uniref:autotransporter assembly complex protein TamA n=1 Tax=Saccharospirillum mangrovi TaxID=2161747 RepID=UPI0013B44D6C|nr:BamA/TamA family outer membrane protein [Saccharospirillum mangrovi]
MLTTLNGAFTIHIETALHKGFVITANRFLPTVLGVALVMTISLARAEELPSIRRSDITVSPGNRALQGELLDQLRQYRDSLRAIQLSPRSNRLAEGERQRMTQWLDSRGYYDAEILHRIEETDDGEQLHYRVDTGPRYQVLSVDIQGVELELPDDWPEASVGEPLDAETILADQSALQTIVDDQGCFFQLSLSHEVRLVPEEAGGHVRYRVNAGQVSRIGDVQFRGADEINAAYLLRQTGLKSGACFRRADLDQAVINLYQTQLFATVRRSLSRDADGNVLVTFDLVQRSPRTIRAGIGWDTDQGLGLTLGWENRNLAHRAQWLELGTSLQQERQSANVILTLPGFLEARNTLTVNNSASHETPEDDEYYIYESRATIDRRASSRDTYSYGLAYRRSDERVDGEWSTFSLVRVPLAYQFDGSAGSLNPVDGKRYNVGAEQVWSLSGSSDPFWIGTLGWSGFTPASDELVIATRVEWFSLWPLTRTADLDNVPASDRLLAGGGGSVRGYPYRSIGINGTDQSGTQQWQGSLELRAQVSDNWGLVLFADSASISDNWDPTSSDQDWYSGAGVGLRYFTRFAPIRVDVAMPLRPREGDPTYQLYISLGQAF